MKFLLVLAVVLVAFWVWRNNRSQDADRAQAPAPRKPLPPVAMVACLQCGAHLPENEAIKGPRGAYCCAEHRALHERQGS